MAFRHWRRVPSTYLPLLGGPLLRRLAWLRDGLASTDNTWVFGKIVSEHLDLLSDTSRMLAQLEGAIGHATDDLVSCASPSWDGLQQLHDALLDYWLHRGPPSTSGNAVVDPALVFGPPPIPSNARFQAITNVAQLEEEGQLMKHCVATRAPDILAGQCYIYRVSVCGERGTLQVGIRPGGLVIEEFRLRNNANPSPSAWRVVQGWISRYTPKS